jgi:hypothetical protein
MSGRSLNIRTLPWKRFLAEAALIVSSVYLAIVLEGASTKQDKKMEAIAALTNLRAELVSDRADGLEIVSLQQLQARSHQEIQDWLSKPENIPADLFSAAIEHALTDNRTVFPRKSSWTTMVAEGQLAILGDPHLVSSLANLYEHANPRLEYNGDRYDDTTQDILRVWLPQTWDLAENQFLTTEKAAIRTFGNQMLQAQRQNRGYMALVVKWLEEVENVQMQVDIYLDRSRKGAEKSVN